MNERVGEDLSRGTDPYVRVALAFGVAAILARALPALFQTFWVDEAASWWIIDGGWTELAARWRQWPYHSLAHSAAALAARRWIGHGEWALRLPSVLAAIVSLFLFHRLARRLSGPTGAAAALVALLGGPSFYFALTTARPYALGMLALLVSWSALCVWESLSVPRRVALWAAAAAAVPYFHFTLALGVVAQLPCLAARWQSGSRRERRAWSLAVTLALVACLPLAGSLRSTAAQVPALDMFWESSAKSHPLTTLTPSVLGFQLVLVVAVAVVCGAWPPATTPRMRVDALRVVGPLWLLPILVTATAHHLGVAALNHDRYQLAGQLGLALAVGLTVGAVPALRARRAAVALLALAAPFTCISRHWPLYDGVDWRAASQASRRLATPAEFVLVPSPFIESNHESHFADLEGVGKLSANLVAYPLAATPVVLPRDVTPTTEPFAKRRLGLLGLAEQPRFVLLQVAQGPWFAWLLRTHPEFEPVRFYRWHQLQWIEFEHRGAARPAAPAAAALSSRR